METKKIISSLSFKLLERFAVKGMGLIIGIVLARMLLPEDFGQIAIITVFINLANTIIQAGFNSALVQKEKIEDEDYSTVFYICMILAAIMVVLLWLFAPLISVFYELPILIWPIRIYSLSLFFGSFNSIQVAKMQREMRFKQMMISSFISTFISGLVGVVMAYMNFAIWALVIYGCAATVLSCLTMLPVAHWMPRLTFSFKSAKTMFSFGWKMLISGILCSLYNDLRSLIIGKRYSSEALGFYNKGYQYPNVMSSTVDSAVQAVMFPAMSRIQSDKKQIVALLRRSISIGNFVIAPIMIGFASIADKFVILLLTEKWLPCVIYLQIVCFAEIAVSFASSSLIAIKAVGRSDVYMKLEFFRRAIMIGILATSLIVFDSPIAIAVSYIVTSWVDVVVISIPLKRLFGYGFFAQIKDTIKSLLASFVMGGIVFAVGRLPLSILVSCLLQIMVGMMSYVLLCVLFKVDSLNSLLLMIRNKATKNRGVQ